ncbi:MAG: phosphopantetheine-binding protein [Chthoniobacteraceae bacterium]
MNTTDEKAIRAKLRAFILASIHVPDLADDDNLFESGIVNSLFAVQLMTFIEKTFAIEVGMDDLEIANFKSIEASAEFVIRKQALPAAA